MSADPRLDAVLRLSAAVNRVAATRRALSHDDKAALRAAVTDAIAALFGRPIGAEPADRAAAREAVIGFLDGLTQRGIANAEIVAWVNETAFQRTSARAA